MGEKSRKPKIRFAGFTEDWEQRRLGELAEFNPPSAIPDDFEYVDLESVIGTELVAHRREIKYSAPSRAQRLARYGDLFYQLVRPYQKNNYLFELHLDNFVFSTGYAQLRPFTNGYFLLSLVQNEYFVQKVLDNCTGTSYPAINTNDLAEIEVYTSLTSQEQNHIGTFFRHLDQLIILHQRKRDRLGNIKKAMLEKMFPKNGADVPEVRFAGFTEAWEQRNLEDFIDISSAARVHKNEWTTTGVPFFRSSDVVSAFKGESNEKAFISYSLYEELAKKSGTVQKDDVLITGGGSIGIPYLVRNNKPLYFKDADLLWLKRSQNFVGNFLYTFFTAPIFITYIQSISHIGTIAHYTIEQAKDTPIQLPTVDEQRRIGAFFTSLDHLITLHQRKVKLLQNIKKACLETMFV